MRRNKVKQLWSEGKTAVNGWLQIPSSWSAEIMANQGFDSLVIDVQHGLMGVETVLPMLQAISTTDTVPLARTSWNEPGEIGKLLDAGVYGIICPMVNSREECEKFVRACRYFPQGHRSWGATRARVYAGADYTDHANDEVITMAMIETAVAVQNAEEIISVDGLDAIYIGPADLRLTMTKGTKPVPMDDPQFLAALEKVVTVCEKHGVVPGIHCGNSKMALKMQARGFRFITLWTDTGLLGAHANQMVTAFRSGEEDGSGNEGVY